MAKESYYGGDIKFIKTDNLRENLIQDNFDHFLSNEGNEEIKRSALKENDIIVTIIGATYDIIGRACLIEKEILPANINQNIALIRVDKNKISPFYLNIYLNTFYGRGYLHYLSRQTEQVNLNCREVEELHIPFFRLTFRRELKVLCYLLSGIELLLIRNMQKLKICC
jgi:restriction endonuclease S subunit